MRFDKFIFFNFILKYILFMAHKKIVYVESSFILRWYRLDLADVLSLQSFIRENWSNIPDQFRQSLLNIYNSLNAPKNPRNTKFIDA